MRILSSADFTPPSGVRYTRSPESPEIKSYVSRILEEGDRALEDILGSPARRVEPGCLRAEAGTLDPFVDRSLRWAWDRLVDFHTPGHRAGLRPPRRGGTAGICLPSQGPGAALGLLTAGAAARAEGWGSLVASVNLGGRPPGPSLAAVSLIAEAEILDLEGVYAAPALARGTRVVPRVDFILGPRTPDMAAVFEVLGPEVPSSLWTYGPLAVVADSEALPPDLLALDFLAQWQLDPHGSMYLITDDPELARSTARHLKSYLQEEGQLELDMVITSSLKESLDLLRQIAPPVAYLALRDDQLPASPDLPALVFTGPGSPPCSFPPVAHLEGGSRETTGMTVLEAPQGIEQENYAFYRSLGPPAASRALSRRPFLQVKLNSNELSVPLPPEVERAARDSAAGIDWNRYPNLAPTGLKEALADYTGFPAEWLTVGAGCDELILACTLAFRDFKWFISWPDFWVYRQTAEWAGVDFSLLNLTRDFQFNRAGLLKSLKEQDPGRCLAVVSNPNNPTGALFSPDALKEVLERGAWLILDEAYYEFGGFTGASWLRDYPRLIILRTLSKAFGLAGLRVGYAMAHPEVIDRIEDRKLALSVTSYSQEVARVLVQHSDTILPRLSAVKEQREQLARALAGLGLKVHPSHTNFLLVRTGDAATWVERLAARGFLVRGFPMMERLDDHIRITVGTEEENQALVWVFKDLLEDNGRGQRPPAEPG